MSYSKLWMHLLCIPLLFLWTNLSAQEPCECTNCPVGVTDNGTFDANLTVSTAGPNNLALCPLQEVCFTIDHTWVGDLFVTLTSPSNLEYFVMADAGNATGGCGTAEPNVDVCITLGTGNPLTNNTEYVCNNGNPCLVDNDWTVPCGGVNSPLSTAVQAPGCDLNAFNVAGNPVNGLWVLSITDVCAQDVGFLTNWSLSFECGLLDCFTCSANGGELTQPDVESCRFEPELIQNPFPFYQNPLDTPDPAEYGYAFVIVDDNTGAIISIVPTVNLISADPGTYTVCGLSYYFDDFGDAQLFVGQQYNTLVADLASGNPSFCGDLSDNCYEVTVLQDSEDTDVSDVLCLGDCYEIGAFIFCNPGLHVMNLVNQDGCDSVVNLYLDPIFPVFNSIQELVCEGDSILIGGILYGEGDTLINGIAANGCDSTTSIIVSEFIVESGIYPLVPGLDSLSCTNNMVQVEAYGSIDGLYEWFDSDGSLVNTGEDFEVTIAGCYELIVSRDSSGYFCTDTASICIGEILPEIVDPVIDGETFLCVGDTIVYSIINPDPAYIDYSWNLPADIVILSGGDGFSSVEIEWNSMFTGDICVQAETACGFSDEVCLAISFEFELEAPVVDGDALVCIGDAVYYSASVDGSDEFFWTITGGSILSGQFTEEVSVFWGTDGGTICASGLSYCGTGPASCFDVAANFPPTIATISGEDTICAGSITSYLLDVDTNTDSIFWDVPSCVQILSGQNSEELELSWPEDCSGGVICVETYNVCGAGETDCFDVVVIPVAVPQSIQGPIEVCFGTYEFVQPDLPEAISYLWTSSAGNIISGQDNDTINVNFLDVGLVELCVEISTECHVLDPNCLTIEVLGTISSPVIEGSNLVCPDSTVQYSLISSDPLVSSYLWTSSCGVIIGSATSDSGVSVDWTSCPSGGQVCLEATGLCGEIEITCLDVEMIAIPASQDLLGPDEVCSFDTISFEASGIETDILEYLWNIPDCATLISGQGTNQIELVFSEFCATESVCVSATNACAFGPENCLDVFVNTPPATGDISGEDIVCLETEYLYSIPPIAEATDYIWSFSGATILSGQGTEAIELIWTEGGDQTITLSITTDCGLIPVADFAVFVQANMEVPEILGEDLVCDSTIVTYSLLNGIPEVLSFNWTTSCGLILSGQGTSSIEIDWTDCLVGGQVCVIANGPCDNSPEVCFDVSVQTNPESPIIQGVVASCESSLDSYFVDSQGAEDYDWTILGGQIIDGISTDSISVEWDTEGIGQVCVQTSNTCGLSPQVCMDVEIDGLPVVPILDGVDLTCIDESQTYSILNLESDIIGIDWTITNSIGFIFSGQSTDEIVVNWLGSDVGEICVSVENECGISQACIEVNVIDIPEPIAGADDVICGLSYSLEGSGGSGLVNWSLVSGPGSVYFENENELSTEVTVDQSGLYVFELEINDSGCLAFDQVEIRFDEIPTLGVVTAPVCDDIADNYTITIEVLNGSEPYTVNGLSGTWLGNIFTSDLIPSGDSYDVEIYDDNGCGPVVLSGEHICPCISDAGTYVIQEIDLCGDEVYDLQLGLDAIFDANDILTYYILSELPVDTIDSASILNVSQDDTIYFVAGMEYGVEYFVVIAVGNELAGTTDLNDPCLSLSEVASINFTQNPEVSFVLNEQEFCEEESVVVSMSIQHSTCADIIISDGSGNNFEFYCVGDGDELVLGEFAPGNYNLVIESITGQDCIGIPGADTDVIVYQVPELEITELVEVCNSTDSGNSTFFNLTDIIELGNGPFEWENLDNCLASGTMPALDFEGVAPGNYTFRVSTTIASAPCVDEALEFTIVVLDCTCPNLNVSIPAVHCNGDALIDLGQYLEDPTVLVNWNLSNTPPVGVYSPPNLTTSTLDITGSTPGLYTLGLLFNGTAPVGCVLENSLNVHLSGQLSSGTPLDLVEFCEGDEAFIDLSNLLNGADTGGSWTEISAVASSGGGFDSANGTLNIYSEQSGLYQFEYLVDSEDPCLDESSVIEVLVHALPIAEVEAFDTITCVNLEVELSAYKEDSYVFEWSDQSNLNVVIGTNASLTVNEAGAFSLEVIDEETGCISSESIEIPAYLEVPIPEIVISDVDCYGDENGLVEVLSIDGGVSPYYLSFDNEYYSDLTIFPSLAAGDYTLSIEDAFGCVTNAIVSIDQPEPMEVTIDPLFNVSGEELVGYGDSLQVFSNINIAMDLIDSIVWSPSALVACDTCLNTWLHPEGTTIFDLDVFAGNCSANTLLSVFVKKDYPVYFPNVIAINSSNNVFYPQGDYMADVVNYLKIYDRWGSLVFEDYNFAPNDPSHGWTGQVNGQNVEAGTYIFVSEILFIDGHKELFKGDVSIIK